MATFIGFPEPEPKFEGTPNASFSRLLLEAGEHAERYPSVLDRMVDNALHSTQANQRRKAINWIHQNASYLFKA